MFVEGSVRKGPNVCVVGGGIGGLATAAALIHIAGYEDVCVLEKRRCVQCNTAASAAVQLGPNGLRALRAIGGEKFLEEVLQNGSTLQGNIIYPSTQLGGSSNQNNFYASRTNNTSLDNLPELMIRWDVLQSLLGTLLPPSVGVQSQVGQDIAGYRILVGSSQEDDDKEVVSRTIVELINTDHQPFVIPDRENRFSLVVAADGINSLFRSLIHAKQTISTNPQIACRENIQDLGRINFKAVVPVDLSECINADQFRNNTTYCYFPPHSGIACFAGPAGKGYTYWAVSLMMTTADSIVQKPAQEISGEDQETESYFGWDIHIQHESSQVAIKERLLELLTSKLNIPPEWDFIVPLITQTDASSLRMIRSEEVPINDHSLVSTDGCVVLVGDAAHAMSASYGQAASFALEDAVTLAICLRNNPIEGVTTALHEYSQRRVSRCLEMQRQAADRAAKQLRGEPTEDISSWIYQWSIE